MVNLETKTKIQNYDNFHKNFANKIIHYVGIPLVLYSTIALLSVVGKDNYNLALLFIAIITYYYWRSVSKTTAIVFFIGAILFYMISAYIPLGYNIGLFLFACFIQIAGNIFCEKNTNISKAFNSLLIGPAWLVNKIVANKN